MLNSHTIKLLNLKTALSWCICYAVTKMHNVCAVNYTPVVRSPPGCCIVILGSGSLAIPEGNVSMGPTNTVRSTHMHTAVVYSYCDPQCHKTMSHFGDKDKHLCCKLLTWSVTGAEPNQVLLFQCAADLSRIQGADHQCVSCINY